MTLTLDTFSPPIAKSDSLRVCIVSGESRATTGGLAAYARMLVKEFVANAVRVETVARFDRPEATRMDYAAGSVGTGKPIDGLPTKLVEASRPWRLILNRLNHVTDRKSLRGLAPKIFTRAYGPAVERTISNDVDVVHFIGAGRELLGFTALRAARKRSAIFTIWPAVHPHTWGDSPLDVDLYKQADAVFCQSNHEVHHLEALGVARQKLIHAALAPVASCDGNGVAFRKKHSLGTRPLVLFIGRRWKTKGFHALCDAIPAIVEKVPDVCLVAIGPDGEKPYPAVAATNYLDLGLASEADKADALAACDLLCMPSTTEAFGIVYVEAWSYRKAVIGGDAPAVGELITDGENGYCVTQEPASVAAVVSRVLLDDALRARLGQNGFDLQSSRYNWPAVTQLHLDVFHSLQSAKTR